MSGGLALDRLLVDHASGLHFELLLDPAVRSGPVGVGSSKGVAISDDGSSKGLFTLFWMARSAAVSPRMRQRSTAGRGGAGGAATVLPPRRPCASMFSLERSPGEWTPPEVGPWPFKFASGTNENALTALTSGSSRVAAPAVQDTLSDICHSSARRKKLPAMHRV